MGGTSCRNCCSDQRVQVAPLSESNFVCEGDAGIWGEDVQSSGKSVLCVEALECPTKAAGQALLRLEFSVKGTKEEVGLELQMTPEPEPALVVTGVDPQGELARTVEGSPGVCPGDTITEVDHVTGSPTDLFARLRRFCSSASRFALTVRARPHCFPVELIRAGRHWQRLGLTVVLKADKSFMMIAAVHEVGLVQGWNSRQSQACICVGDRITSVNGKGGDAISMYALVQASPLNGMLHLLLEPPPRYLVPVLQAWAKAGGDNITKPGEHLETL